jgi:hypothetical protein
MVAALASLLHSELAPRSIKLENGCKVQVDGFSESPPVLCESFARLTALKAGQKRKLGNDVLKLLLIERALAGNQWRKILAVASEEVHGWLTGNSWQAAALREFGVEVVQVPISPELAGLIANAQAEQVMVNRGEHDV